MAQRIDTIVIGGGQAGLSISYYLKQQGREHLVLERNRIAESWRSQRWDSFTLVTPNWTLRLPGFHYQGEDPDGFLTRDQVVGHLEAYAESFGPPLRTGVEVASVTRDPGGAGYLVATSDGDYLASNVVVAVGSFQRPKLPESSEELAATVTQIHASHYRNPDALPEGAVLVVGSGQSGCQIAEELNHAGRNVYLAAGSAGRMPRRYRGKDLTWWVDRLGIADRTVDQLDSPADRFAANPQATGKNGGHNIGLHTLARDGVTLLGHLESCQGTIARFAPDLPETLERSDRAVAELKANIDKAIEKLGLTAPEADPAEDPELRDGYEAKLITELDLEGAGITTVVWATGFGFDFSWIELPVLDAFGYPAQERGVTRFPGLYFLGLQWLHTLKSALLFGVGDDARHVAEAIAGNARASPLRSAAESQADGLHPLANPLPDNHT